MKSSKGLKKDGEEEKECRDIDNKVEEKGWGAPEAGLAI